MIYVGTVGEGVFRSSDDGDTFSRNYEGMFLEADVRARATSSSNPNRLYAGTNMGLYRSEDGGDNWSRLHAPFDPGDGWMGGVAVWSLLVLPGEPEKILAGVCPSALYLSADAGDTWLQAETKLSPECVAIRFPRVTCLVADPADPLSLWAGVEIDGIHKSSDGGKTWIRIGEGLSSMDIHSLVVLPREGVNGARTLLASTNNDLNVSADGGETWVPQNVKDSFTWRYCRGLWQKPDDPDTLFLGNGNGPPGTEGAIRISRDGGASWKQASLPVEPNSTIWAFAASQSEPDKVCAYSVSGQLFLTRDAGNSWIKLRREFGEIRSLLLT